MLGPPMRLPVGESGDAARVGVSSVICAGASERDGVVGTGAVYDEDASARKLDCESSTRECVKSAVTYPLVHSWTLRAGTFDDRLHNDPVPVL